MELKVGMKNKISEVAVHEKTAQVLGSGLLPVYATPAMIALMEKCSHECVGPYLDEGQGTVGTLVNVKHISATPEGDTVRVESTLTEVDGRRLVFDVVAYDHAGKIGEGTHERFIIVEEKFLKKTQEK